MSIDLDRMDRVEPMFRSYLDASEGDR